MGLAEQTMQEVTVFQGFKRENRFMFYSFKLQTDNGTEAFNKSIEKIFCLI